MIINLDYKKIFLDEEKKISIEIKSVNSAIYSQLVRFMRKMYHSQKNMRNDTNDQKIEMGMENLENPELYELSKLILPSHTRNLKGIQIKESGSIRECAIEDLLNTGAGLSYCVSILSQIFTLSSVSEEEAEEVKKR